MTERDVAAVILAAGKGTRMKSDIPKVVHDLLGKPILSYVIKACRDAGIERIVPVIGYGAEIVKKRMGSDLEYVEQVEQLGTGHALLMASKMLSDFKGDVLVIVGDAPLLTPEIINRIISHHRKKMADATIMTIVMDPPPPYGRIIRDRDRRVIRIVEEKDATLQQKKITELNSSHYCFKFEKILPLLSLLKSDNKQGEYYLTDIIELLAGIDAKIETISVDDPRILIGINSRADLAEVANILMKEILNGLMKKGVSIIDPSSVYIEADVKISRDSVIYPFTSVMGKTSIGRGCRIGPNVKLLNAEIGNNCIIEFSVIENRKIKQGSTIGPFAYIS